MSVRALTTINLAAGDVVLAAVEGRGLREAGDRVLGGRIGRRAGPRRVRGQRSVVDDAAAARVLALHDAERLLRAEEHPGQVHGDHLLPLLVCPILQRGPGTGGTRVVEEDVHAAEGLDRPGEAGALTPDR